MKINDIKNVNDLIEYYQLLCKRKDERIIEQEQRIIKLEEENKKCVKAYFKVYALCELMLDFFKDKINKNS